MSFILERFLCESVLCFYEGTLLMGIYIINILQR